MKKTVFNKILLGPPIRGKNTQCPKGLPSLRAFKIRIYRVFGFRFRALVVFFFWGGVRFKDSYIRAL